MERIIVRKNHWKFVTSVGKYTIHSMCSFIESPAITLWNDSESLIWSTSPYCSFLCEIFIFCKFKISQNLDLEWEIANKNQLFVPFEAVGLSISGHLSTQVYLRSVLSFYMGLVWVPIGSLFLEMMSNLLMSRVAVLTTCKTDYLGCFLFPCEIQLKPPTNSFKRVKNSYALKQIFIRNNFYFTVCITVRS